MSHDDAGGRAIAVVRRNTEEVQGRGDFLGIAPTGRDGRIVEHWGVADLYGIVGQLEAPTDGLGETSC